MDKNNILIVKGFGVINILFGLFWLVIFSVPFGAVVLMGWITDEKITSQLYWFIAYVLDRMAFTIAFVFSIPLIMAGFFLLVKKQDGRKLAIYSSIALIESITIAFLLSLVDPGFIALTLVIIGLSVDFVQWFISRSRLTYIYVLFLIYSIMQLIYLSQPKIKEIFDDDKVKVSLVIPIIFCIVSFFMPQIGWAIKWLSGGYK